MRISQIYFIYWDFLIDVVFPKTIISNIPNKATAICCGVQRKGVNMYEKFVALLEKSGKTAYRVSKDTGISASVFSDWKSGKSKPKIDKLKKIADYFGVTLEYFVES